jgi:hypothetical protein
MSLEEVWLAASSSPFHPVIPRDSQFSIAFWLIVIGALALFLCKM